MKLKLFFTMRFCRAINYYCTLFSKNTARFTKIYKSLVVPVAVRSKA